MTVPKSKRATSSMEYIRTADRLAEQMLGFHVGMPKRMQHSIGNLMLEHALEVSFCVASANQTYVSDEATFNQRRGFLNEAEAHLTHVERLLGIYHMRVVRMANENQCKYPNDNVYESFAELIEKERKLISGCKRRDTQAYNRREAGGEGTS